MDNYIQYGALGLLAAILMGMLPIARALAKAHLANLERLIKTQDGILGRIDTAERAVQENINETRHAIRDFLTETNAKVDRVSAKVEGLPRAMLRSSPGE